MVWVFYNVEVYMCLLMFCFQGDLWYDSIFTSNYSVLRTLGPMIHNNIEERNIHNKGTWK